MSEQDSNVTRTLIMVVAALVVFMVISLVVANLLSGPDKTAERVQDPRVQARIEANIKPVAKVNIGDTAPVMAVSANPQEIYQAACASCHATGAVGAPKLSDKAAWKSRVAQGSSTLYDHAINGFKAMPPKGGRPDLSDDAVSAVVDYIVSQVK
ncbi:MAG: c-type cytochrome [Gammaproteobacteria bacterium]